MNLKSCEQFAKEKKEALKEYLKDVNKRPLLIFNTKEDRASNSYIRGKVKDCREIGFDSVVYNIHDLKECDYFKVEKEMVKMIELIKPAGVIIQRPLNDNYPSYIEDYIHNYLIFNGKELKSFRRFDIDGLMTGSPYTPCTALGVVNWLEYNDILLEGKVATVIGRSKLAGAAIAKAFESLNATVIQCNSYTSISKITSFINESDIIVSATGNYNLFHKYINLDEILKHDKGHEKIFIDVGIINKDGKLVGDIPDFEIFNRENYYKTPVPKGVGLLTRVGMLENLCEANNLRNPTDDIRNG